MFLNQQIFCVKVLKYSKNSINIVEITQKIRLNLVLGYDIIPIRNKRK